jgi:lipopolysaccharide/colanic/teichoic acid biosynthesis glycosyltransferase
MARFLKRLFDVAVAALFLLLLWPLYLLVALLILANLGRPAVFRHLRPGYQARPFTLFKFRTMTDARDSEGKLLPDGERLTGLGRWLRRFSLDELPQMWNVLCGEMSLVGPRPLLMQYLDRYTPEQARRHDVPPGMTGWTQVKGRNALTWEEKFSLDLWYVDHWSLWLDARILLLTVGLVLKGEGVSLPGHATTTEFMGSPKRD